MLTSIYCSRITLFIIATLGVSISLYKDGLNALLYYTLISNSLVILYVGYLLIRMQRKRDTTQLRSKAAITMVITLTGLVYHFMLAPQVSIEKYYRLENFICHYIVPIWFILDTLLIDKKNIIYKTDPLWWTVFPISYATFGLMNGLIFKINIPNAMHSPFPYFFLDVYHYGWLQVSVYIISIGIGYILIGYIYYFLKKYISLH